MFSRSAISSRPLYFWECWINGHSRTLEQYCSSFLFLGIWPSSLHSHPCQSLDHIFHHFPYLEYSPEILPVLFLIPSSWLFSSAFSRCFSRCFSSIQVGVHSDGVQKAWPWSEALNRIDATLAWLASWRKTGRVVEVNRWKRVDHLPFFC